MPKRFRIVGLVLAAALPLSACLTAQVPEGAFFYPDARVAAEKIRLEPGVDLPASAEAVAVPYPGGTVGITRVRTGRADAPLILFCGGNLFRRAVYGGNAARKLTLFGDVLMFDYPGYGDTSGTADYAGFHAAGEAVAALARRQADAEGRRVIAWGHSLGGPVCAQAARSMNADALVLEATTPSARAAVDDMLGWKRAVVRVRLAPALAAIDVPAALDGYPGKVVVLEAGRDKTLPPSLSRALARGLEARSVAVERLVFPNADHHDIGDQPDFQARVAAALP